MMICHQAGGQSVLRAIDSLEATLSQVPDTALPRVYAELSYLARFSNPIIGIRYALQAMDASEDFGNEYYMVESRNLLALNERFAKMLNESADHYEQALRLAQKFKNQHQVAQCYNNIARININLGDFDHAKVMNDSAFIVAKACDDSLAISNAYLNLGLLMHQRGKSELALGYLKESYQIRTRILSKHDSEGLLPLWHMADIYVEMGDYDNAKAMMYMNFDNEQLSNWHDFSSRLWYKLAQIYYRTGMLDSAVYSGLQALEYSNSCYDVQKIENTCKLLNSIYIAMNDYESASKISSDFVSICDTLYNQQLSEQLMTIQFSDAYQQNNKDYRSEKFNRMVSVIMLLFAIVALLGSGYFFMQMVMKNRHIRSMNKELSQKRKSTEYSLRYAHAFQMAIQPMQENFGEVFSDKFLLYIPRDIVSGDFFWRYTDDNYEMLVVADCTGHGVPGAMLTMLGTSILQDIASRGLRKSGDILEELRARIKYMMRVNSKSKMQDGMDISMIVIDRSTMMLDFAGAYNNLVFIRDGELFEIKASRCPIGEYIMERPFVSQYFQLKKGDCLYMMSDGFASQFGGDDNHKYSNRRLLKLLLDHHTEPMADFCAYLTNHFHEWRGENEQIDDVTVAGFRV